MVPKFQHHYFRTLTCQVFHGSIYDLLVTLILASIFKSSIQDIHKLIICYDVITFLSQLDFEFIIPQWLFNCSPDGNIIIIGVS